MSTRITYTDDPEQFVKDNRDVLTDILKHGDDTFARAGALALLVRYGDDPDLNQVQRELEAARREFE